MLSYQCYPTRGKQQNTHESVTLLPAKETNKHISELRLPSCYIESWDEIKWEFSCQSNKMLVIEWHKKNACEIPS